MRPLGRTQNAILTVMHNTVMFCGTKLMLFEGLLAQLCFVVHIVWAGVRTDSVLVFIDLKKISEQFKLFRI